MLLDSDFMTEDGQHKREVLDGSLDRAATTSGPRLSPAQQAQLAMRDGGDVVLLDAPKT